MKKLRKILIVLLCAALASVFLVMLVACRPDDTPVPKPDPTPTPQGYSVTLDFDQQQGSVTLTPPANGDKYVADENVTITVAAARGYKIASVTVDGTNVKLVNNKYSFAVARDTDVVVAFAPLTEQELAIENAIYAIKDSALFDATMVEEDLDTHQQFESVYKTAFDETNHAALFDSYYNGAIYSTLLIADVQGKAAIVSHDEFGKVVRDVSEEDFADYDNPFKDLTWQDFTYNGDSKWSIDDLAVAQRIVATLTTYYENVTWFELTVRQDGSVGIFVECQDGALNVARTYDITVVTEGVDGSLSSRFADYEETAEHETLRQALQNAADATSYTVGYHRVELGEPDVDGHFFVTPDGLYEDLVDWENGYVTRPDGNVWQFFKNDDTGEFYFSPDFLKNIDLSDLGADFVIQEASLSLLQYRGDGVFAMRFEDTVMDGYYSLFPGYFAQYFATGLDEPRYFSTAISFEIELRDGVLYRVHFVYDYYGQISEDVTLTFGNWNSTELPITLSDDFINGTVEGDYCGSWADDSFAYALTVTPDTARLNGYDAENIVKTANGYEFQAGGRTYRMTLNGDTLVLQDGSTAVYLHQTQCPWLDFLGIYSGADGNDVPYSVVIGENTLTLFAGGSITTIGEFEFGFEFSQQEETYIYTFDFVCNGAHAFLYLNANQTNQFVYGEDHDNDADDKTVVLTIADCRWEKFLGAFEGVENGVTYRAVVAPYGVYLFDGDGTMYVAQNIEYNSYEGFTFDVEGAEDSVCLGQNGYTQEVKSVALYWEHTIRRNVEMDRVTAGGAVHPTDELFMQEFWGTWVSEDGSVTMVITANKLTINGEEIAASYDNMGGYQIKWGVYVAMEIAIWKGDGWLVLSNDDTSVEMYFKKV